jgi:hypothetical protein
MHKPEEFNSEQFLLKTYKLLEHNKNEYEKAEQEA